ncbi:hypothetical protein MNBD_UNCLBAC01-417 [hydrothermal vent metagenome]|uniref:Uncharacterized protein n=1 Tax=hydrothermal vent metagenome TaxID=652676 RepID=A0A3B1E558_9ZZZZ
MTKKLIVLGILSLMIMTTSISFAEDVFVTKRGKKYHTEVCKLIKNKDALKPIAKEGALEKYTPCKRCFPVKAINKEIKE